MDSKEGVRFGFQLSLYRCELTTTECAAVFSRVISEKQEMYIQRYRFVQDMRSAVEI